MIWFWTSAILAPGVVWFAYLALEWAYRRGFREGHAKAMADMYALGMSSFADAEARIEVRSARLRRTKGPVA